MTGPFRPSMPSPSDPGRLSASSSLQPGWPCRHCGHPLGLVRNQNTRLYTLTVACCRCDQAGAGGPRV